MLKIIQNLIQHRTVFFLDYLMKSFSDQQDKCFRLPPSPTLPAYQSKANI